MLTGEDTYVYQIIFLRSGVGEDQVRIIAAYDPSTKIVTVGEDWSIVPNVTTAYVILPARVYPISEIVEDIWSYDASGLTSGTVGYKLWNNVKETINKVVPFLFAK